MSLRTTAVLDTTFPYDSVDENGEFVFYAGRNISEMIAAQLEVRGYKVRDIQHRQEMGWAVVVESERLAASPVTLVTISEAPWEPARFMRPLVRKVNLGLFVLFQLYIA